MVSTLQDMVGRLGNIEASLKTIADRMVDSEPSPVVPFARKQK
jgi:hypothetical protein